MDPVKPLKYALAAGAVAGTIMLSGCADPLNWGSAFAPKPSAGTPRPSASSAPATSGAPTQAPSSEAPSASATPSAVTAKASGSMKLYANEVSRRFAGTCTTADTIKIVVADHANDFYGTVDVTTVLNADATQVSSILAVFGEDSEGITRKISYTGDAPAKGTSAKLTAAGQRYQISGNGLATETRNGKDTNRLIPYTLDLTCTGS